MTTLRALRDVIIEIWREGPRLLTDWLDRVAGDLNRFNGRSK